jgi:hypothetical protein
MSNAEAARIEKEQSREAMERLWQQVARNCPSNTVAIRPGLASASKKGAEAPLNHPPFGEEC